MLIARVLVVDDFKPFRRYLRSMLDKEPELRVVGEASDGMEALQKVEDLQPDLILLDVGLPQLNGIEVGRQVSKLAPRAKILFLSQEFSFDLVQEAFRLGALGYVHKQRAADELLLAIKAVLSGMLFVSSGLHDSQPSGAKHTHCHEVVYVFRQFGSSRQLYQFYCGQPFGWHQDHCRRDETPSGGHLSTTEGSGPVCRCRD